MRVSSFTCADVALGLLGGYAKLPLLPQESFSQVQDLPALWERLSDLQTVLHVSTGCYRLPDLLRHWLRVFSPAGGLFQFDILNIGHRGRLYSLCSDHQNRLLVRSGR